jgi:hypothetical protein
MIPRLGRAIARAEAPLLTLDIWWGERTREP